MGYEFPCCHYAVDNHPFIMHYLKGVFNFGYNLSPRYQVTWDLNPVLEYVELLHPLGKLSLEDLTFKRLALTLGGAVSNTVISENWYHGENAWLLFILHPGSCQAGQTWGKSSCRFLLGRTLKYPKESLTLLLNTILEKPNLSVTMAMAIFSFHMSCLIGTLVRVQLRDGLKLLWEQVE